jgi:type III secretion system (T3SS) inner membrane Yop/YscD-like protein
MSSPEIRITRDEALSPHVDELLQRQRNMRGQRALGEKRTPWYFRNWLVLSLAGLLGAFLAWAVIEPHFDDVLHVQGRISSVEAQERTFGEGGEISLQGEMVLQLDGGERVQVLLPTRVREIRGEEVGETLEIARLAAGTRIGLYAEEVSTADNELAVARFIDFAPPAPGGKASSSLRSLQRRSMVAGFLLFSVVAALVGLAVGSADGIVCRQPRRALLCGFVGLIVGLFGGLVSSLLANVAYFPFTSLAGQWMRGSWAAVGFLLQVAGRSLAWALAGMAMGLGQGVALRSQRLLLFGFLGGTLGGLLGGLLFDPLDLVILGGDKPSAHWARLLGLAVIGASVGAMIGVVELLARDAWLRMSEGPLAGKEFLLFKDVLRIGSDAGSEIYLFGDPQVQPHHATLRTVGDDFEVESRARALPVLVNGRPVDRRRLNHGDQIAIGRTVFVFQRRQG